MFLVSLLLLLLFCESFKALFSLFDPISGMLSTFPDAQRIFIMPDRFFVFFSFKSLIALLDEFIEPFLFLFPLGKDAFDLADP